MANKENITGRPFDDGFEPAPLIERISCPITGKPTNVKYLKEVVYLVTSTMCDNCNYKKDCS